MASEIKVDTISEKTSAGGVTIDGLLIKDGGISGDVSLIGTTPTFTIGDAGAEDATLLFDGNAQDYYIALDDSADDLLIGLGSTVGTTPAISIDENLAIKTYGDITMTGTTPVLTIGDAGAEDTAIVFDGNAQDFYVGLDDSADDLVIGLGSSVGTTPAISINSDRDVTISDGAIDFDIASHDTSNGLKLGGTLVTATAAELNIMDGVGSTAAELNMLDGSAKSTSSITLADADAFIVIDGNTTKQIPASDISTYAGGGITVADDWKVTSSFTGGANPISANLAQTNHAAQGQLGSAMTVSSGIWTFPSTGYWYVAARAKFLIDTANGAVTYDAIYIGATTDNSSYSNCAHSSQGVFTAAAANNTTYETFVYTILDVTNVTNVKVRFQFDTANTAREVYAPGGTATDTGFTFIRLGDT